MGLKAWAARGRYNTSLNGVACMNGKIRRGVRSWPVAGASCTVESGASSSRMTLTRVGAGAVVLGPVGAILGGLAKKDRSRVYVVLTVPGDGEHPGEVFSFDVPVKDEKDAREFASKVNAAALAFA